MAMFVPAEVFPPGVIIRGELEARGWTQGDLAEVMERPLQMVNEIISARKRVTEETAKELEAALGIDAEFWLKTEALYRLQHAEPAPSAIKQRAGIRRRVPLRFMIARGWLNASDDAAKLETAVRKYLGVDDLAEHPPFVMAARQTKYDQPLTEIQEVWLLRLKQMAETMVIPDYSPSRLSQATTQLRELLGSVDDARHVSKILSLAGVRLVVAERLAGLGIDGVCFWLSPSRPVIGLSLTRDRIDNFWFVLRHEIEHVLNGDGKDGAIVDNDLDDATDVSEQERRANEAAADFCIPRAELEDFMLRKGPLYTGDNIRRFAQVHGVHSGIVAGQLRKRLRAGPLGDKAWRMFTPHLAKIRHVILETAFVDGFGRVAPVGP